MSQLYKIKKINLQITIITIAVMMLFSCNLTKNLKYNEKLLVKNNVTIIENNTDIKDPGFEEYDIKQVIKPKTKFVILPVSLWVYYLYDSNKIEKIENKKNNRCIKKKKRKINRVSNKIRNAEKEINDSETNSSEFSKLNKRLLKLQNIKEEREEKDCNKLHWSQKIGESPVLYKLNDEYRNKRRIRVLLKNKGYYNPLIKVKSKTHVNHFYRIFLPYPTLLLKNSERILYSNKNYPGINILKYFCNYQINNKKKLIVNYKIDPGKPYIINKFDYNIEDSVIKRIVLSDSANFLIKEGLRLDTKLIDKERKRITDILRDAGYYKFLKDYIYFSVDTIGKNNLSELLLNIKNPVNDSGEIVFHKKYKIRDVYIYPNYKPKEVLLNKEEYFLKNETIIFYSKGGVKYNIIYNDIPRINPRSLVKGLYIAPGKYYNTNDIKATYKYLISLQIIQIANINFKDVQISEKSDSFGNLDCIIKLTQDKLQSNTVTNEITNSSGNIGFAIGNDYEHQNIFRNAEVISLKTNIAFKRLTSSSDYEFTDTTSFFNSREFGGDLSLKFPRLVAPFAWKKFIKRSNPNTILHFNYNYLERPDYTRSIAGLSFGYNWRSSNTISHTLIPMTTDFVKLRNPIDTFRYYIEEYNLEEIYADRLVVGFSYKFTFNNQLSSQKRNFFFFSMNSKPAGNLMSVMMNLTGQEKEDGSYQIAGNTFAQFIKGDFDFRYYRKLDREKDKLVFRFFTGIAYPYGNLNVIPFSERYSSGGANGIRAWQIRTLGPGTYKSEDDVYYPNQTSDIKLEANFEYRMKLFWMLEGALFVDAGNIWAINEYDTRDGAQFDFNDFYKEIAVGPGFGIRLDVDFVVIRVDFGRKLYDPSKKINRRLVTYRDYTKISEIWTFNFAIGFPF